MSKGFKTDVVIEGGFKSTKGTSDFEVHTNELILDNTNGLYKFGTVPTKDSDLSTNELLARDTVSRNMRTINTKRFEVLYGTGAPVDGSTTAWYVNQLYIDVTVADSPVFYRALTKSTNPDNYYTAGVGSTWSLVPFDSPDATLVTTNRPTASYTLVISDRDKLVEMNVYMANNLTVPPNASVAFATGTQILLSQYGAGQTSVVAGAGVTIRSADSALKFRVRYSGATLVKIATNEWYLFGDIAL